MGVQGFLRVGVRRNAFFVVDIFGHFCHCFCVKTSGRVDEGSLDLS